MHRLKKRITQFLLVLILSFRKFNASESIIIFSEPRGGSTWLMEILHQLLPVCIQWEPLHKQRGVVPNDMLFGARPFISESDDSPEYAALFRRIHDYRLHSKWTRLYLGISDAFSARQVLIKYVRANLLVPYLLTTFEFKYKPIFLLRHPIDTCISQAKTFGSPNNSITLTAESIGNKAFTEHSDFLNSLHSDLELCIARWCIYNCPTLASIDDTQVCIVYYSDLLSAPDQETRRILSEIGFVNTSMNVDQLNFRKASTSDFKGDYNASPEIQLNKNLDRLEPETKDRIQSIFDHFEFKVYSAYSSLPDKQILSSAPLTDQ